VKERSEGIEPRDASGETDDGILVVRRGPGANCSSIGSAVEMLFLSATIGAAVLAAVAAALRPASAEGEKPEGEREREPKQP
jgi:hypothetical protein